MLCDDIVIWACVHRFVSCRVVGLWEWECVGFRLKCTGVRVWISWVYICVELSLSLGGRIDLDLW